MGILIPKTIDIDEPCIRLLFHPLMVSESNRKLRREAMLPKPQRNDVSLQRLNYTSIERIVEIGSGMNYGSNHLWGYATVKARDVEDNNVACEGAEAHITYAPMHRGEYASRDVDLYVDDKNVDMPMHADMLYSNPLPREESKVRTAMRKYATALVKRMNGSISEINNNER